MLGLGSGPHSSEVSMKIEPGNPLKPKSSKPKNDAKCRPDELVEGVFKVNKAYYVPTGVEVRSRINATMFTGKLQNEVLEKMDDDTNVISVSLSKSLRLID